MKRFIRKHPDILILAILVIILVSLFARSFTPGWSVAGGDAGIPAFKTAQYNMVPYGFVARWIARQGLGRSASPLYLTPGVSLTYLVPATKYADVNYILHLLLLGGLGYFFLLDLTRRRLPALLGAVFLMLQPRVFSHLLPGHLGYFMLLGWLPGAFWFLRKAVRTGFWAHWGLAGGFLGVGLSNGGQDVGFFFAVLLGAYGVFLLTREIRMIWHARHPVLEPAVPAGNQTAETAVTPNQDRSRYNGFAGFALRTPAGILVAGIVTFLLSYQMLGVALEQARRSPMGSPADAAGQSAEQAAETAREQWFWATQWSVPIEESLEFGIPGFLGWGSSNRENPYRGRIGQTEGYPEHGQGMPNLNDVSIYMGAVILLAALLALVYRRRDGEVWFWFCAALIACLLGYGKHAPFYRLFYTLPYMDAMRNPIKWMYVTSFCVGILGTIGFAEVFRRAESSAARTTSRLSLIVLLVVPGLVFVLGGLLLVATRRNDPDALFFWQHTQFVAASYRAVGVAAVFWFAAAALFYWLLRPVGATMLIGDKRNVDDLGSRSAGAGRADPRHKKAARKQARKHGDGKRGDNRRTMTILGIPVRVVIPALLLFGLLLGELLYVNVRYRPYYRTDTRVYGGELAEVINREDPPFRIRVLGDQPVMQYFRRVVARHYGWEQAELPTARTADDFHHLQRAVGNDLTRLFDLTNVRFVIAPGRIDHPQLQAVVTMQSGEQPIILYRYTGGLPRYFVVPRWRQVPPGERFDAVADRRFDPASEALIHVRGEGIPAVPDPAATEYTCDIIEYSWRRIVLNVRCDAPAMLVGLDRYDPAWRVFINGEPVPLWQANGMLRAVPVPAGEHEIELRLVGDGYRPLMVVGVGWLVVLGCGFKVAGDARHKTLAEGGMKDL